MSPNAVFEYAGDRDATDEDNVKDIEVQEEEIRRYGSNAWYCPKLLLLRAINNRLRNLGFFTSLFLNMKYACVNVLPLL